MAYCIDCQKNVGCSCNLIDSKFCSQECKDKYLNKQNDSLEPKILQQLQQPKTITTGDRPEII